MWHRLASNIIQSSPGSVLKVFFSIWNKKECVYAQTKQSSFWKGNLDLKNVPGSHSTKVKDKKYPFNFSLFTFCRKKTAVDFLNAHHLMFQESFKLAQLQYSIHILKVSEGKTFRCKIHWFSIETYHNDRLVCMSAVPLSCLHFFRWRSWTRQTKQWAR